MADMVGNFDLQAGSLQECSLPRSPMLVKYEILHKNGLLEAATVLPCMYQPRPCFLNLIMIPLAISFTIRVPVGGSIGISGGGYAERHQEKIYFVTWASEAEDALDVFCQLRRQSFGQLASRDTQETRETPGDT